MWTRPAFNPNKVVRYSIYLYPGGMKGWVELAFKLVVALVGYELSVDSRLYIQVGPTVGLGLPTW